MPDAPRVVRSRWATARAAATLAALGGLLVLGIVLRMRPMPQRVVGGGLIGVTLVLLLVWGQAARRRGA